MTKLSFTTDPERRPERGRPSPATSTDTATPEAEPFTPSTLHRRQVQTRERSLYGAWGQYEEN